MLSLPLLGGQSVINRVLKTTVELVTQKVGLVKLLRLGESSNKRQYSEKKRHLSAPSYHHLSKQNRFAFPVCELPLSPPLFFLSLHCVEVVVVVVWPLQPSFFQSSAGKKRNVWCVQSFLHNSQAGLMALSCHLSPILFTIPTLTSSFQPSLASSLTLLCFYFLQTNSPVTKINFLKLLTTYCY